MRPLRAQIWLVESLSLSRLFAALLFAAVIFQNVSIALPATLYTFAMCSDVLDGYLARKFEADTYFGKVLDLVSDKSLTIVSLLYAAERGINFLPLALIGTREVIMIGARLIIIEGTQLFPTNRFLGGVFWFLLWGNTLFLVLSGSRLPLVRTANLIYWLCAIVFVLNFIARVYVSAPRIRASLSEDE